MSFTLSRQQFNRRKDIYNVFGIFINNNYVGGIVLLTATLLALFAANSGSMNFIKDVWNISADFSIGNFKLEMSLLHWVNDALMVVFFFVVGLEIKREMIVGELSSFKQASLPILAAIGGMVAPALIYTIINSGEAGQNGWGIPMATDIAFSLGVISLLGSRVPVSLKIFLTALAIVDDIGSILVLAVFYPSHELHFHYLVYAGGIILLLMLFNRMNIHNAGLYLVPGVLLWYFVYQSGIHATIAGVALAMCIPARASINEVRFYVRSKYFLDKFRESSRSELNVLANKKQLNLIHSLHSTLRKANPLINRFEHTINPWVTYSIMPVFALANAGVSLDVLPQVNAMPKIFTGIFLGLLVGKPLGIFIASYIACKLKIAELPKDVRWSQLFSVGIIAGIGFTMSIFIDSLAFSNEMMINEGKGSIIITSFLAAAIGLTALRFTTEKPKPRMRRLVS